MTHKYWTLVALLGWGLATIAIVNDWEFRASLAYLGGTIFGLASVYAYKPPR